MNPGPHTVELAEGWGLWRTVCLRGTGFPAAGVLNLSAPRLAEAADAWLAREADALGARDAALRVCMEATQGATREMGKLLGRAVRRLRAGELPALAGASPQVEQALAALAAARAAADSEQRALRSAFDTEAARCSATLRETASGDAFRAALAWQNVHALTRGVDFLLRQPPGATGFKVRQNEALVASYWQRYCVRNETIGFFGPVGWARWSPEAPAVSLQPGSGLVETRTVYFEYWAIDTLATRLAQDPDLRPQLCPRRLPTVWLDGTRLHTPIDRVSELPQDFAQALAACDGTHSAAEIARRLRMTPSLDLSSDEEAYEILEELERHRLISWSLATPSDGPFPERHLRAALLRLAPSPARSSALASLDSLEEARAAVAHAGDSRALVQALGELSARFTRLTGHGDSRNPGETYAGRTLVYEDCRRAIDARLGPDLLKPLAAPLALLLQSARWYTYTLAEKYKALFQRELAILREQVGRPEVDFLRFFERASLHLKTKAGPPVVVTEVLEEFHRRWREVLGPLDGENPVHCRADALREAVQRVFAAPRPGWPKARHVAPDLMVAATDEEAIRRGDFLLVLGELHVGQCTTTHMLLLKEHPHPEEVVRAREADLGTGWVNFVEPRAIAGRAVDVSPSDHDFDVETGDAPSGRPRSQVLEVGELVVEEREDGELVVRTRDRRRAWNVLEFLERHLIAEASDHFRLFPSARHSPRISIDRLVIQREAWSFESSELPFIHEENPLERFIGARRWRRAAGIPRFVFVRSPRERKPCYVDFDSLIFTDLFAKIARQGASVSLSEMLPGLDQAWLTDASGNRYTCELRMTAVDPVPGSAPGAN